MIVGLAGGQIAMHQEPYPDQASQRRVGRLRLVIMAALLFGVTGVVSCLRPTDPHGKSHACSKCLGGLLRSYAADHNGWMPNGKATPEASLGLVLELDTNAVEFLCGKHLSRSAVEEALRLEAGLGPASCGWHYVEGLREDDGPQIAVAWDKAVGLGHFGERKPGIMHKIIQADGSTQYINRDRWPEFVAEQKNLLAEAMAKRSPGDPPIRWSDETTLGPNVNPPPPQPASAPRNK